MSRPVLFYDGECALCRSLVRFVIRRNQRARLRFAPLQSAAGRRTLFRLGLPAADFDSLLYLPDLAGSGFLLRSAGALAVLERLGGPWSLLARALRHLPGRWCDAAYAIVARLRHHVPCPARFTSRPRRVVRPTGAAG